MYHLDGRSKRILIIPDCHIPYSHKDYIKFLTRVKEKFDPEVIINLGDELDYHAVSFHKSESELFSAGHELDKAIIEIQEGLHKLFPKMHLLESNHGSLVFRRLKHEGIPVRVLKPLPELYETPNWEWHEDMLLNTNIGKVYLCHGRSGTYGKMTKEYGTHCIQGHFHGKFELTWHVNALSTRYNLFSGCLVDRKSLAMAYGKNNLPMPILGCTLIGKSGFPKLVPMITDKNDNWIGRVL